MSVHFLRSSVRRPSSLRPLLARPFATSSSLLADSPPPYNYDHINSRANDTAVRHREFMLKKPLNPHLTNTTSTIANEFPSVGQDKPPADQLTSVDASYVPKDSVPENTQRMTGGTQTPQPKNGPNAELDVGEIEGGTFRVEPYKREGEEDDNLRARLLYQSRKRGTLESDLLLSSFAHANLPSMSRVQLEAYDTFLDENDWDIYYWATQQASPTSTETAEGGSAALATPQVRGTGPGEAADEATRTATTTRAKAQAEGTPVQGGTKVREPGKGEWSNTVGVFKAAYRPVPTRWKHSEILAMLRRHVLERSAGGVHEGDKPEVQGEGLARHQKGTGGGGLAFMPELINVRQNSSGAQ